MHEYLGLEGGPPMFRQNFTCSALLKDLIARMTHYGAITHYGHDFPDRFVFIFTITTGLVRVRSPLLTESRLMSFPTGT